MRPDGIQGLMQTGVLAPLLSLIFLTSPVLASTKIFATHNDPTYKSHVFAYDLATGTRTVIDSWPGSFDALAVGQGTVFATYNHPTYSSYVFAYDLATGTRTVIDSWPGTYASISVLLPVPFEMDIKPAGEPNSINLLANGLLPVAILGSDTFDVSQIDQGTLVLAESTPQERGKSGNFGSFEDVNGDGLMDLMLLFPIRDLDLEPEATLAELTGDLLDGTPILGSDSVRLLRAGDANLDGFVDIQDFGILKDNFGLGAGWSEGDFNEDGIVDIQDFAALKDQFGTGGAGVSPLPEPASATLLLIGLPWLTCLAGRRIRRRSRR